MLEGPDGRRLALGIEFAPKPTARLRTIAHGYLAGDFDAVRVLVESPALARRIAGIFASLRESELGALGAGGALPEMQVLPWLDADDGTRTAIVDRVRAADARHAPDAHRRAA